MYLILFLLIRVVLSLSISLPATVTIGVDTPVQWADNRRNSEGFDLYLNSLRNDLWGVDTLGRSGSYSIVIGTDWSPGSYTLLAEYWESGNVDASANFELVAPPSQTATVTVSATPTTVTTGPSTTSTSSISSTTSSQSTTSTTHSTTTTSSSSVSHNTTSASHGSTSSSQSSQSSSASSTIGLTSGSSQTTSSIIPDPSSLPTSSTSQSKLPIILGAILGALVLLVLLALLIFCCRRRRKGPMISPFQELVSTPREEPKLPGISGPETLARNSDSPANERPEHIGLDNDFPVRTPAIGRPENSTTSLIPAETHWHNSASGHSENLAASLVPAGAHWHTLASGLKNSATSLIPVYEEETIPSYVPPLNPVPMKEKELELDPMVNHGAAIVEITRLRSEVERLRLSRSSVPPAYVS